MPAAEAGWAIPTWLRPLQNRRFRRLLLALVAIPLGLQDLLLNILAPVFDRGYAPKDFWVYLQAARDLGAGRDPYLTFLNSHIPDPAFNRGYIYPPLLAWLLKPLGPLQGHWLDVAELLFLQAVLGVTLWLLLRALRVRSGELAVLLVVLAVGWYPVWADVVTGQVNHVLLLLTVVWFAGWLDGDRWWSGLALGAGIAVKLLTAPLLALTAWGRRWRSAAVAVAAIAVLWAVSLPWLLPEYFTRVAPAVAGGTGFRENQAPTGALSRLLIPSTLYGQTGPMPAPIRALGLAIGLAVVVATVLAIRRPSEVREVRALEAAATLAAMPLVVAMQTPTQYVTVLIALAALTVHGFRARDLTTLAAVGATWVLTGPAHTAVLDAIGHGVTAYAVLEPASEITGVIPLTLLWLASLRALTRARETSSTASQVTIQPGPIASASSAST